MHAVVFMHTCKCKYVYLAVCDICDYIMQVNVDLVFLCETWLRSVGDEADCAVRYMGFYGYFFYAKLDVSA